MSEYIVESTEVDNSKFPYRYLLRWSWPDHIEALIRRMMWNWLSQANEDGEQKTQGDSSTEAVTDLMALRAMWLIAIHPDSPGAVLQVIADQCADGFVERVAENPGTWPSTLRKLAKHSSPRVRAAVAQNPSTTSHELFELACDESPDVRYAMADGAQGDVQILQHLIEDDNPYVVSRAKRTLARLFPPAMAQMPFRKPSTSTEKQGLKKVAEG